MNIDGFFSNFKEKQVRGREDEAEGDKKIFLHAVVVWYSALFHQLEVNVRVSINGKYCGSEKFARA